MRKLEAWEHRRQVRKREEDWRIFVNAVMRAPPDVCACGCDREASTCPHGRVSLAPLLVDVSNRQQRDYGHWAGATDPTLRTPRPGAGWPGCGPPAVVEWANHTPLTNGRSSADARGAPAAGSEVLAPHCALRNVCAVTVPVTARCGPPTQGAWSRRRVNCARAPLRVPRLGCVLAARPGGRAARFASL